jgi:hypothetical protein
MFNGILCFYVAINRAHVYIRISITVLINNKTHNIMYYRVSRRVFCFFFYLTDFTGKPEITMRVAL